MRNKLKNRLGFTMAELLIVVAIIGVLSGVGFVAVQSHQRNLAQLERDTVAKELFVAAQNHLALAKSEGYTGTSTDTTYYGTQGNAVADEGNPDVYYFYSGDGFKEGSLLNRMLPFGAIDETVRTGHYIIRYQPKAAIVLDVFYWTTDDPVSRFNCNSLSGSDYATLMGYIKPTDQHKKYPGGTLGWFGGEEKVDTGVALTAPDIEVENGERLLVTVKDNNPDKTGVSLKLIISGQSSGAMAALPLGILGGNRVSVSSNAYTVVLDDITSANLHFAQINGEGGFEFLMNGTGNIPFIPGENITVQAVSYSNTSLTSVAYSGEVTTNSLFAETSQRTLAQAYAELTHAEDAGNPAETDTWITAKIGCFRHLENLNAQISYLDHNDLSEKLSIAYAMQTADLDWGAYLKQFGDSVTIYDIDGNAATPGCFVPVSPSTCTQSTTKNATLTYNGNGVVSTGTGDVISYDYEPHSITGIKVDVTDGNAGLFGTLIGGGISNLDLVDFSVKSASGNAGALAGAMDGTQVSNVLARESAAPTTATTDVTAVGGSAGGLVGSMSGGSVERCAAALTVSGDVYAGGLIGMISGSASVKESYSGGHTEAVSLGDGSTAVRYSATNYNVTATGTAGGFIGSMSGGSVERCYSTCSATGATAGGLVGASSGTITDSYCTGLVKGTTTEGAFAGGLTGTASGCRYYEIINERATLKPLGAGTSDGIAPLDGSAESYDSFVGGADTWNGATPYLEKLKVDFGNKYTLMTVDQLGATTKAATPDKPGFVATHYGDWPVPEIFTVNVK